MKATDSIINLKVYTSRVSKKSRNRKNSVLQYIFQIDIWTDCFKFRDSSPKKCFRFEERYIEHIT